MNIVNILRKQKYYIINYDSIKDDCWVIDYVIIVEYVHIMCHFGINNFNGERKKKNSILLYSFYNIYNRI